MAGHPSDAETAGQRADPVAAKGDDLARTGGSASASGGPEGPGDARPSGERPSAAPAGTPAPRVHNAMDEEVRDAEEKARKLSRP